MREQQLTVRLEPREESLLMLVVRREMHNLTRGRAWMSAKGAAATVSRVHSQNTTSQTLSRSVGERLDEICDLLREMSRRQARAEEREDEFRRVYLDAKFPHGRPTDPWGPRR